MVEESPTDANTGTTRSALPRYLISKCPRCGGPLEEGYAVVGSWVNWVRERGLVDAGLLKRDRLVTFGEALGPHGAHIPGLRCRSCNIAILDLAYTQ